MENLLARLSFDTQRMMQEFPPEIQNRNKLEVFKIACPKGCVHSGEIVFSRWSEIPLPETVTISEWLTNIQIREDVFGYTSAFGYYEYAACIHSESQTVKY